MSKYKTHFMLKPILLTKTFNTWQSVIKDDPDLNGISPDHKKCTMFKPKAPYQELIISFRRVRTPNSINLREHFSVFHRMTCLN